MRLTQALKRWTVANCKGVTDASSDDDVRKAAGLALATGDLSHEKYVELAADEDSGAAGRGGV